MQKHYQTILEGESKIPGVQMEFQKIYEDAALGVIERISGAVRRYKNDIVREYHRLQGSPSAQREAVEMVKRKFAVTESLREDFLNEGMISSAWNNMLRAVFGGGFVIGILSLAILVVAAELWVFTWLFGSVAQAVITTIIFGAIKVTVYDNVRRKT